MTFLLSNSSVLTCKTFPSLFATIANAFPFPMLTTLPILILYYDCSFLQFWLIFFSRLELSSSGHTSRLTIGNIFPKKILLVRFDILLVILIINQLANVKIGCLYPRITSKNMIEFWILTVQLNSFQLTLVKISTQLNRFEQIGIRYLSVLFV